MKADWKYVDFNKVFPIKMGKTPPRGDTSCWDTNKTTNNKWVSIADISANEGGILLDTKEYITDTAAAKIFKAKRGSLLMSFKLSIGKMAFAGVDLFTNEAIIAIPESPLYNLRFLYYYISGYDWKHLTDGADKVKGKTLNKESIGRIQLPVISLSEQGEIVAYLDKEFALIDALREKATLQLQAAKDLFQSALKQLLTPKQGWEEKKICSVGEVRIGPFGSLLHKSDYVLGGVPLINPMHIISGVIKADINYSVSLSKANELSAYRMRTKDIVLGRRGEMGRCAVVEDSQSGFLCGTGSMFFRPNPTIVNPYFLSLLLQSEEGVSKLSNVAGGATMQNLSSKAFGSTLVFLPPLSEQEEIVRKLDALSEKCRLLEENYRQTITLCNDLKQALLRQVFE